jgi:hypothetical protein
LRSCTFRSGKVGLAGLLFAGSLVIAAPAAAQTGGVPGGTTSTTTTTTTTPAPSGSTAILNPDGSATAPAGAPKQVRKAINAGNRIRFKPYLWGGGHRSFKSRGYDCSGAVSYLLHAAGMLKRPLASGPLMKWGSPGIGSWITVYANSGHTYVVVAGLRYDTSAVGESLNQGSGPRWRATARSSVGYAARYRPGF